MCISVMWLGWRREFLCTMRVKDEDRQLLLPACLLILFLKSALTLSFRTCSCVAVVQIMKID